MQGTLSTLRDVEGVLGSFVIDRDGGVLARDVPAVLDDQALLGAGRRLSRMRVALENISARVDQCSLRFGEYLLLAKPADGATLCVLVSGASNLMALQMGATLVARRLQQQVHATPAQASRVEPRQSLPAYTPSAPVALPPPAAPASARASESAPPTRFFRGRPI